MFFTYVTVNISQEITPGKTVQVKFSFKNAIRHTVLFINADMLYTNVLPTVFQMSTSQKGRSGQPPRPEKRFVEGLTTTLR